MTFTLVGHRGAMGLEPENTLRSFRRAVEEGADAIELDLRLSADGQLVILHDSDVERTTDGKGKVAEMTLAEIKALDAGEGESIPTFDEVLDSVALPIQAEIKAPDAARAALDTIRDRGLFDRITVTSFSADIIRATIEYLPEVRTGLISSRARRESVDLAREMGVPLLCLGLAELDAEFVELCRQERLEVIGWPANDENQLVHALRIGADGVTSDFPGLLRDSSRRVPEVETLLANRPGVESARG
ncbi:glycerophosphodiester phosphodiesterase [Actinopolymorpha alba]|uniref:glycerophosphodiester phosphodiesterase n=1 Tax=Actinopolymorpha alba TaxID=533267 RepID=UPI0003822EF9|nr:glycerophosphodiester phosphodiesterase family protein [Actinopolymorpha alba]